MLKLLFGEKIWYDGLLFNSGESYNVLMLLVAVLAIAAVAYLLGNVNTVILITRLVYKEDIRTKGSGNPGMTNVMRNYGWLPALFTLLGDMFKCMLSMVVGTLVFGILGAYIAGLFCVLGHIAPVIYKFKGGKGVSSSAMFLLYVNPLAFLITLIIFVLIVLSTKYLSLASVITVLMMPLLLYRMEAMMDPIGAMVFSPIRVIITLLNALLVVFLHRENIKRIMNKTERRFSIKRTVKKGEAAVEELPPEPAEETEEDEDVEYIYVDEEEESSPEALARKAENRKKSKSKKK